MCLSHTLLILGQCALSLFNTLKGQLTIYDAEIVNCVDSKLLAGFKIAAAR